MGKERVVHPECVNASNPYHECVEYCFLKIVEEAKAKSASKDSDISLFGMLAVCRQGKSGTATPLSAMKTTDTAAVGHKASRDPKDKDLTQDPKDKDKAKRVAGETYKRKGKTGGSLEILGVKRARQHLVPADDAPLETERGPARVQAGRRHRRHWSRTTQVEGFVCQEPSQKTFDEAQHDYEDEMSWMKTLDSVTLREEMLKYAHMNNALMCYLPDRIIDEAKRADEAVEARDACEDALCQAHLRIKELKAAVKKEASAHAAMKKAAAVLKVSVEELRQQLDETNTKLKNAIPEYLESVEYLEQRLADNAEVSNMGYIAGVLQAVERFSHLHPEIKYFTPDYSRTMGVELKDGVAQPPPGVDDESTKGVAAQNVEPDAQVDERVSANPAEPTDSASAA